MKQVRIFNTPKPLDEMLGRSIYNGEMRRLARSVHKRWDKTLARSIYERWVITNPNRMWTAIVSDAIEFDMPPQNFP